MPDKKHKSDNRKDFRRTTVELQKCSTIYSQNGKFSIGICKLFFSYKVLHFAAIKAE